MEGRERSQLSMNHAVRKLDCKVKERKGKQACVKMGVFPKERGHAGRGQGLLNGKASRDVISLWGGSGVVAKGSPNEDQESGWRAMPFSVVLQNPKSV